MKLLLEISEKSIGLGTQERFEKPYILRKAARAIVVYKEKIAFQYITKKKYYQLPGGGVVHGETLMEALKREILEEVGCEIEISKPVGMIIEYRNKRNLLQISYCYLATSIGKLGKPKLEKAEIREGLQPIWISLEEAIDFMQKMKSKDYSGKFIKKRDLLFLQEAQKILNT